MKFKIENTEEQVALIKAMASKDRNIAYEAQAAVATLMGPLINEVINNAPSVSNIFSSMSFSEDDNPSIPLDLFHEITDEDYIKVYSQQVAGGLPYSQVFPAHNELKFTTYDINSAFAFDKKYARKSRLDVVGKTFARMSQEILLKQEKTSFNVIASALINASTKSSAGGSAAAGNHIIGATNADRFVLNDFNRLLTLSKRINASFSSGTPVGGSKVGVTDLMVSPEMIQELRAMAYNPINTNTGPVAGTGTDGIVAPDELRMQLYSAAGLPAFYGINIVEVLEMGQGQRFNQIFEAVRAAAGVTISQKAGGGTGNWDASTDEILIGIDRSRESLIRPVVQEEDSPSEFSLMVDDQFVGRQNKVGYYGNLNEGRVILDDRALVGLFV